MKPELKVLIIIISLLIFSGQAFALRCGHRIVGTGDGKAKIFMRCGEPDFTETRERRIPKGCVTNVYMNEYEYTDRYHYHSCRIEISEVWTYNFGVTKFMRELVFVDGVLDEINMLGYGY